MTGLEKAIATAGTQVRLASLLGITTQSVNRWVNKYRGVVPADRVLAIYRATGVTPHELRPDLHPTPASGIPADCNPKTQQGGDF